MVAAASKGRGIGRGNFYQIQSHGILGVLNEWPSCRSTAASGSRITAIHTVVMSYESSAVGAVF